jgi:DNA-directed RNA polymerase sigma subunit (sigma70/sigma32)
MLIERTNMKRDEWLKVYLKEIEKTAAEMPGLEGSEGECERRAQMIRSHLQLVVKLALEERGEADGPLLDLIAAGNIGLVKAVMLFDPEKEGDLAVFAGWWIRQSVKREAAKLAKQVAGLFASVKPHQGSQDDLALPA